MKRAIRNLILMVGLACAFIAATSPVVMADGGIIPTCNPDHPSPDCGGK